MSGGVFKKMDKNGTIQSIQKTKNKEQADKAQHALRQEVQENTIE